MSERSYSVCIYCGVDVAKGDNCCAECHAAYKDRDVAIGAYASHIEWLLERLMKHLGVGNEQD